jgi:hypothetical protein
MHRAHDRAVSEWGIENRVWYPSLKKRRFWRVISAEEGKSCGWQKDLESSINLWMLFVPKLGRRDFLGVERNRTLGLAEWVLQHKLFVFPRVFNTEIGADAGLAAYRDENANLCIAPRHLVAIPKVVSSLKKLSTNNFSLWSNHQTSSS